jgi:thiamine pyrophosphokinase
LPFTAQDTVIVVSGGISPGELGPIAIPPARHVIAADSGAATALELGLHVDELIGDLDSVSPQDLALVEAGGGRVHRHRAAKDATDLELALAAAAAMEPERILVLGGTSGRFDHLLAGALLLASPAWAGVDSTRAHVEAWLGRARVTVIRGPAVLEAEPGELLSLLAVGAVARGVTTAGLLYPLRGEDLPPGSSRGVSNEFTGASATVNLTGGVLLAVAPGETGAEAR